MKKSLIALLVIGSVATAGLLYVNHQAEDAIKQQLAQANQSYQDLAAQGEMPLIALAYKDVSANVLLSSYSISGLEVNFGEMGTVATVEHIQAKGMKPQSLSDKGSLKLTAVKVAPAVLQMLPPQTSVFLQDIALHGDYDYHYNENGELLFNQQTRINDEFSVSYSVSFTQMQQFWQFARDMSALPPEQQQALASDEVYISQMIDKLASGALKNGSITVENNGFIERTLAMTAEMGQTPDYRTVQGMALVGVGSAEQLPQQVRDTLTAFVQKPEKLTLSFGFTEPLPFAKVQSGELAEHMMSPEAMIKFANLKLVAN